MSLEILSPGLLTTVQDLGRHGFQKDGIIVSGAMDAFALRFANLLVGNPDKAAGIEITLMGPQIRFTADHLISITGADLSPTVDGSPLKMWRPVRVAKGSTLSFGKPVRGCRAYLAVAGSFELPPVLGSLSTYLRAGLGGMAGRALQAGDVIPCQHPPEASGLIFPELGKSADTFKAA
ncbi:MAG: biotin-dependent carboxyltransferase family protein, partial [Hymenobacteraceae bacterium]|nr:biotin-dependent carboxyltransferase family protein [Hymenobacteraceae bacterium]